MQILACDFFTIESVFLKTVYGLFVLEVSTRRVYVVGCTSQADSCMVHPTSAAAGLDPSADRQSQAYLIHEGHEVYVSTSGEVVLPIKSGKVTQIKLDLPCLGLTGISWRANLPGTLGWDGCDTDRLTRPQGDFLEDNQVARKGAQAPRSILCN